MGYKVSKEIYLLTVPYIIADYKSGMLLKDMTAKYDYSGPAISAIIKSNGIERDRALRDKDQSFLSKIHKTESCWLWLGSTVREGYGKYTSNKKYWQAHRYSYTFFKGPIPEGLLVMHTCDVRNCVNPDHLRIGTQSDNIQDMLSKNRGRFQKVTQQGECCG